MRLSDETVERACAHLGETRLRSLDRPWVEAQLRLREHGLTHDETCVEQIDAQAYLGLAGGLLAGSKALLDHPDAPE